MHKLLVLYPDPLSREDFERHYVQQHLPLVARLPGLLASRHAFDVQAVGAASPYFCIWEGEFEDAQAMAHAMSSDIGKQVAADAAKHATGGLVLLHCSPVAG